MENQVKKFLTKIAQFLNIATVAGIHKHKVNKILEFQFF